MNAFAQRFVGTRQTQAETTADRIIHWCLLLAVFVVPFFFLPFTTEPLELNKMVVFGLLVLVASFAWLTKVAVRRTAGFVRTPLTIPVALFLLCSAIAAAFSFYPARSLAGFSGYVSSSLAATLFFVLFFFLLAQTVRKEHLPRLSFAFFLSAGVLVLFNFAQMFGLHLLPLAVTKSVTFNALANSPLTLGCFLALVVLASLVKFLRVLAAPTPKPMLRMFTAILAIVAFFLLLVIDQQAGWWTLLVGAVLLLFFTLWGERRPHTAAVFLPALLIGVAVIGFFVNFQSVFRANFPSDVQLPARQGWAVATASLKDRPLFGSGQGTFQDVFTKHRPASYNDTAYWNLRFVKSSNEWFQMLSTTGVLTTLAFLAVVVLSIVGQAKLLRKTPRDDPYAAYHFIVFLGTVLLSLALLFTAFNMALAFLFWLFVGLGASFGATETVQRKQQTASLGASLGFALAVVVAIVFVYFAGRVYIADANVGAANRSVAAQEDLTGIQNRLANAIEQFPYEQDTYFNLAQNLLVQAQLAATEEKPDVTKIRTLLTTAVASAQDGWRRDERYGGAAETLATVYQSVDTLSGTPSEATDEAFVTATTVEPRNPRMFLNLGQYELGRGRQAEASEDEATKAEAAGHYTKAGDAFAKAVELKADYIDAHLNRALALRLQGKKDEAVQSLKDLTARYPLNTDVLFQLGEHHFIDGRTDDAKKSYAGVVELYPGHSDAHLRLAQLAEQASDTVTALAEYKEVLRLNPGTQSIQDKIDALSK